MTGGRHDSLSLCEPESGETGKGGACPQSVNENRQILCSAHFVLSFICSGDRKGHPVLLCHRVDFLYAAAVIRSLKVAGADERNHHQGCCRHFSRYVWNGSSIWTKHLWIHYLLLAVMYLPVLYPTVITHNPASSFIACVAYSSVAVSHGFDVSPFSWGINRLIDTMIGILVAYVVNCIHMPARGKRDHLYAVAVMRCRRGKTVCWTIIRRCA